MPLSKRRKRKNGKTVKSSSASRASRLANVESGVTLQDLINVVAYQEFKAGNYDPPMPEETSAQASEFYAKVRTNDDVEIAPGVILRSDAIMNIPDEIPVNIEDERGNKIGVGIATPIPGDPNHVSIQITDPEIMRMIRPPVGDFSIRSDLDG